MNALYLETIAVVLMGAGFIPYLLTVIRGTNKPRLASWLVWASLDTFLMSSMIAAHAVNGQIIIAVAGAWMTFTFTIKYTNGLDMTGTDKACLIGGACGILLCLATRDPRVGILASSAVILLGSIPTVMSAWDTPTEENFLAWTLFELSCVFQLLSMSDWSLAHATQAVIFAIVNTTVFGILLVRRHILVPA